MQEDFVGAFESWRNDEASALVVEGGQNSRGSGFLLNALELRPLRSGPDDIDYRNRFGGGASFPGSFGLPDERARSRGSFGVFCGTRSRGVMGFGLSGFEKVG
jgi:hypothetical protein